MLKLLILLSFMLSQAAFAGNPSLHQVKLSHDLTMKVKIDQYVNSRGMKEMRIYSADLARVTIGYGRDMNRNGVIETFFLLGKEGIVIYRREWPQESSITRALAALKKHGKYSLSDYYLKLLSNVAGLAYMATDNLNRAQATYYQDYMDLAEIHIALKHKAVLLTKAERTYLTSLLVQGQEYALAKLKKSISNSKKLIGLDAILWTFGSIMAKGAAKHLTATKISAAAAGLLTRLSIASMKNSILMATTGLTAKAALSASKRFAFKTVAGAAKEWKYIALTTGIQTGVETYINYNQIKDSNPAIMAENVAKLKEVRLNVVGNVTSALTVSGTQQMVKSGDARMAMMGVIGVTSSAASAAAVNGKTATPKLRFDAAWSGIDVASMVLELKALHTFETMAIKQKNPKLKIVGYAVVLVSQVVNYAAYTKLVKTVSPKDEKSSRVMLVPITASLK